MAHALQITDLRFEHHPTGLGIPVASPRLSWRFRSTDETPDSWNQSSYDVEIIRDSSPNTPRLYNVQGFSSVLVPWPDAPLASGEAAKVRVKSTGVSRGTTVSTEWSSWASVEAGLLSRDDWSAKVISEPERTLEKHADEWGIRPVRFRKTFDVPYSPSRARLYITALGLYEAYVNGTRVGDETLAPGWTSYQGRIQYQVFDVGPLLNSNSHNVLSIEVAEGWYAGRLLWSEGIPCFYGDRIGCLAQLDISSEGGESPIRLITDETWESATSPIVGSDIYDGETYDLSLETPNWHSDGGNWTSRVDILEFPAAELVASSSPPVRVTQTIKPVKVFADPDGVTLVDFGQNLVGKVLIPQLSKPAGHRLCIRHAEVLENNRLGTRPLRRAKQTDTIIFGCGRALDNWSPHFTYHGFRYVELHGWPVEEVKLDSIVALVAHTDMPRTGYFSCSNESINKLHENVTWSTRGNFVSIPTDCPQRDERLGWTGDIQVFSPTASFLFDCAGMLGNWLRDLVIDQKACGGIVPLVVPNAMKHGPWPAVPQAVWDDVIILLPWTLYTWFGDAGVLRETYQGMQDYLRTLQRGDDGLWDPALWQLGDWLDPNAPPAEPGLARTDGVLVADAYLVHVTGIMSKIAGVLGQTSDETKYAEETGKLRSLFQDKYITKAGFVVADSQTAMALALLFDLHDDPIQKKAVADRLAVLVRYSKFRVSTGFAGTPAILHALSESGHTNLAYGMLLQKECPSWLYPVSMGATTIWERWDSMLEDGSINPGQMTSFNHYALGCVAEWIHANIGGVAPLEPAWRKFRVMPRLGGEITSAKVDFLSSQGQVRVSWEVKGRKDFSLKVVVPPNSGAVVQLPDGSQAVDVGSGHHEFGCAVDLDGGEAWPPRPLLTQFRDHEGYRKAYE